jgi:hypothetical protein
MAIERTIEKRKRRRKIADSKRGRGSCHICPPHGGCDNRSHPRWKRAKPKSHEIDRDKIVDQIAAYDDLACPRCGSTDLRYIGIEGEEPDVYECFDCCYVVTVYPEE